MLENLNFKSCAHARATIHLRRTVAMTFSTEKKTKTMHFYLIFIWTKSFKTSLRADNVALLQIFKQNIRMKLGNHEQMEEETLNNIWLRNWLGGCPSIETISSLQEHRNRALSFRNFVPVPFMWGRSGWSTECKFGIRMIELFTEMLFQLCNNVNNWRNTLKACLEFVFKNLIAKVKNSLISECSRKFWNIVLNSHP